eukprot:Filipodium_phascolosomae@DN390_c0_g1_i2.p1
MGQCCSDGRQHKEDLKAETEKNIKQTSAYTSIESKKKGPPVGKDYEKFQGATEKTDIQALVDLLDSVEKIQKSADKMHPWAANPKTVGALAATQLAMIASSQSGADKASSVKHTMRFAGAIPKLTQFLQSQEEDRVHAALVGLSFICDDCEATAKELYDNG